MNDLIYEFFSLENKNSNISNENINNNNELLNFDFFNYNNNSNNISNDNQFNNNNDDILHLNLFNDNNEMFFNSNSFNNSNDENNNFFIYNNKDIINSSNNNRNSNEENQFNNHQINNINFFDETYNYILQNFNILFEQKKYNENIIEKKYTLPEFKEQIDEVYCPICFEIPLYPICCQNCNLIMCKECSKNLEKCPVCRKKFIKEKLKRVMNNIINKIKFYCINKENGCNKILTYENYIKHINNCNFGKYKCLMKNCNFEGDKNQCFIHAKNCSLLKKKCQYCNNYIYNYQFDEHYEQCGNNIINCIYCNNTFKNKDINNHINFYCNEYLIECQKCFKKIKRKEINNHNENECLKEQVNYWKNLYEQSQSVVKELKSRLGEN